MVPEAARDLGARLQEALQALEKVKVGDSMSAADKAGLAAFLDRFGAKAQSEFLPAARALQGSEEPEAQQTRNDAALFFRRLAMLNSWTEGRVARGQEGWVHFEQLTTTLNPDGEPFDLPALGFSDYAARRWEVGTLYGDFGGANVIGVYGSRSFTPNLSGEVWLSQALGRFSDSTLATVNIVHLMYPDWRASPYFTLGAGVIKTEPKATLVATTDRSDSIALAGAGVRMYLSRRFVFRAEYKAHVVFTSRNDNEEVSEWKAGFSFFF